MSKGICTADQTCVYLTGCEKASNGQVPVTVAEIHSNTSEMNHSYLETASNAPTAVVGGGAELSLEERLREVRRGD